MFLPLSPLSCACLGTCVQLYFMLRPHVNMAAPQPVVDAHRGLEYEDEYSQEGRKHGEYGFDGIQDSLGCGPQGCFRV